MKKLLLLGGSRYAIPLIETAHKLGIYVITCDYLPNNIAHKYSDEYCNISIIDKEATLEAARNLNIDGVMVQQKMENGLLSLIRAKKKIYCEFMESTIIF